MAAHQHHRHHHHQNHPTTCCSSSYSHGCSFNCKPNCNSSCDQAFHCPSPPLHSIDPILESHASHQLYAQSHLFHDLQNPSKRLQPQQQPNQRSTDLLISTLVSRIEALEASLCRFPPSRSREASDHGFYSLREVAARVIQTHFRSFLVRRSRTLGQLKDLAIVKSSFSSLRSSISNEIHVDFYYISRKAVDLLVKLDSIQSDDSMVIDGKRSISRDLVRFLDFIEGVSVKRHKLYLEGKKKNKNNVGFCQNGVKHRASMNRNCSDSDLDRREIIRNLKERVEKIHGYTKFSGNDDEDVVLEGFQHVTDDDESEEIEEENQVVVIREKCDPIKNGVFAKKKSVSFAENRNVLNLFSNTDESVSNELDGDSTTWSEDDQIQNREVQDIEASSRGTEGVNNGPKGLPRGIRSGPRIEGEGDYEIRGCYEDGNGEFLFSAPLPVQMEEKTDLLKKISMR